MFGLGVPELIIILLIIVFLFGANRLPGLATGIGKSIKNFKEASRDETAEEKK
jgi:sec-independent protein translocase protein TatA